MTIASQTSRINYTGDGTTTAFAVPFYFLSNADILVYLTAPGGSQVLKVLGTDYALTGAGLSSGGTCTFTTAPTTAYTLTILRDPPVTQTTSYNNNDPFPAKSHENALDKLTTISQRVKDRLNRTVTLQETSSYAALSLPDPQAGQYLRWRQDLAGLENTGAVTFAPNSYPVATQSEAQAGTSNTVLMTPLRTAQEISALVAASVGVPATRTVKIATTTSDSLTGLAARDGVTPVAGDLVLEMNNAIPSKNGIYVAAAGVWSRPTNFDDTTEIMSGVVIYVSMGTANAGKQFVLYTPDNPVVVGTSNLTFVQTAMTSDASQISFQQAGVGTVPMSVIQVLRTWHTIEMYGGGSSKTAAQNAAAFGKARDGLLLNGGTLTVTPGIYACDPVNWIRTDIRNGSMKIQGVSNPSGPANNNAVINFTGTGATPFWNFDSPVGPSISNGTNWSVDSLTFVATDPTFSGALISSTTPVTDASKITNGFVLQNCVLSQSGGVAGVCTLLDIGKTIITTIYHNAFGGGACQIKGQQGLVVAGTAQARQSTTVDLRKNTFQGCNGHPILYGGDGWGCYDNIFEPSAGGRMRCFSTNANYPIRNMTWINNWCGDTTALGGGGDQAFIIYGQGFVFIGNYVSGFNGTAFNAISLIGVKGFNISGNSFDNCSAAVNGDNTTPPNYGSIEGNVLNINIITVGTFAAGVRIAGNGI